MPPRVRATLEAVRALADERLVAVLDAVLDETEQQVFRHAEGARSNAEQQRWLDALRELRRGRSDVAPRFLVALERRLMAPPQAPDADASVETSAGRTVAESLDLVDADEFEAGLILDDGAARAEARFGEALRALGQRFAVLWATPPLAPEVLPIGPRALNRCLVDAIAELRLDPQAIQCLLRVHDRLVLQAAGELFDALNDLLIERGILPHVGDHALRRREDRVPPPSLPPDRGDGAESTPSRTVAPVAGEGAVRASADTAMPPWTAEDQAYFDALCEAVSLKRPGRPPAAGPGVPGAEIGRADLDTVLAHLQSIPNAAPMVGGRRVPQSVGHVRQALLDQLGQTLPEGVRPELHPDDATVIDLMEAFFGSLQQDVHPDPAAERVLVRLQVPMMRLALEDRSFFTREDHPARALLNAIVDAGAAWLEDDAEGRQLIERLAAIGERASVESRQDAGLYRDLLRELETDVSQARRRAEAAERRHVEAARGRERLALARRTADEALTERLAARAPDELLRGTLERAWADVLALTLLRHGADSDAYRRRLAVVDRLLEWRARGGATRDEARALRDEIESGLGLIGYHPTDVRHALAHLIGDAHEEDRDDILTLAMRLRARARLGERRIGEDAEPLDASGEAIPDEASWITRVRELPIGTWVTPVRVGGQRLKIAWRSEALDRLLLVNRRATFAEERSVAWLARGLARGSWRIVLATSKPPVDRAFQRLLGARRPAVDGAFHA